MAEHAAPKACPHAPVETGLGWACKVCGFVLVRAQPVGWIKWYRARRALRREIEQWRNG